MKYYALRPSLDKKIVGNYPQVEKAKHNCHVWDEPKFINNYHFEKIDFEPIVSNAIVKNNAKVTDFIEASVVGFTNKLLVSGKLKNILQEYKKNGIQFFQSGVYHKKRFFEDYWILNPFEFNDECIDFKNSEIYKTKSVVHELELLKINNFDEYKILREEIEKQGYPFGIKFKRLNILSNIKEDFLILRNSYTYTVSEKLKKIIEDAGCTGIEFMPVELNYNEWLFGERIKTYGEAN